jgi:hypothetical protein
MRAALRAGWKRRDLIWERTMERSNLALQSGNQAEAIRGFQNMYMFARIMFDKADPRYATSVANAAYADQLTGKLHRSETRFQTAKKLWAALPPQLENIGISPRARSSLFHLRMEARHWDTYCANAKVRLGKFLEEADEALTNISEGSAPSHRLYSRWRGEKPNVFDDTRKYLSAALLLAGENIKSK